MRRRLSVFLAIATPGTALLGQALPPAEAPATISGSAAEAAYVAAAAKSDRPLEAMIRAGPGGRLFLTPRDAPTLSIPLAPDQVVPELARDTPVSVTLKLVDGATRLSELTLPVLADWKAASQAVRQSPQLAAAMDSLQQASERALQVETSAATENPEHQARDETSQSELAEELYRTEEEIVVEYRKLNEAAPGDIKRRRQLVRLFARIRPSTKAIYGRPDYYSSSSYLTMHTVAKSAVALAVADSQQIICSGVLIADDLVLTALHCLNGTLPEELQALLGYEQRGPVTDAQARVPVLKKVAEGPLLENGVAMDYVVLKLETGVSAHADAPPPHCLSSARLTRDRPIYVVAHTDQRGKTIHDNSWVLFPFAATPHDYARLLLLVEAEFRDAPGTERDKWIRWFRDSYRPTKAHDMYQHYSVRYGRQPTLAAETDTFHGDSGAPVFDRLTHKVVGIVLGGEEDALEPWQPGWRRHEAIMPASQILADLARFPEVREAVNECSLPAGSTPARVGLPPSSP